MARRYFGTDGIRGQSNVFPMTPDLAMRVGIAVGTIFRRGNHRIASSSARIRDCPAHAGKCAGGRIYRSRSRCLPARPDPDAGRRHADPVIARRYRVMISASHNPFADNGIKLFGPMANKLSDELELNREKRISIRIFIRSSPSRARSSAPSASMATSIAISIFVKRTLPRDVTLSGLRIAIDCANGAAYKVAPTALWELGADVVTIGNTPNGTNINLDCGSTSPEALRNKVHEVRADIGIALDGDADRVIIIDENGSIIDGDQLMAVIAESWAEDEKLRGGGIVATVMSNLGLERFLHTKGLTLARTKVGDRYVVEHMRNHDFNVGGEQSGHLVLSDFGTTGDVWCGASDPCAGQAARSFGQRGVPKVRAGAAASAQRAHRWRQAAG